MYDYYNKKGQEKSINELLRDQEFLDMCYCTGDLISNLSSDNYIFEDIYHDEKINSQDTPEKGYYKEKISKILVELKLDLINLEEKWKQLDKKRNTAESDIRSNDLYVETAKKEARKEAYRKMGLANDYIILTRDTLRKDLGYVKRVLSKSMETYKISVTLHNIYLLERTGIFEDMPGLKEQMLTQPIGTEYIINRVLISEDEYKELKSKEVKLEEQLEIVEAKLKLKRQGVEKLIKDILEEKKVEERRKKNTELALEIEEIFEKMNIIEEEISKVKEQINDLLEELNMAEAVYSDMSTLERDLFFNGYIKGQLV